MRRLAVAALIPLAALLLAGAGGSSPQSVWPPAPANLEVTARGPTSINVAWGPTVPGPMSVTAETANSVTVGWGASEDSRGGIVAYEVKKDGKIVQSAYVPTSWRFVVQRKATTFTICVRAKNAAGQFGPDRCTSFTRG